ncbi:uncharacterized protein F4822DRAFT_199817 [Hypoxylon trugodes]|uniref:uncharacterized protein n=1 Tax=Hypoxylon trugodes TaxID=326681 RepID=UPI0021A0C523|nr:uncharacterized protein F4822DRAFT_199817 [Hypoxylon trugodes]KAI1389425.1 hypothetical protein F4822DRAFT_199817 [Hypoxylon trugodes]
MSVELGLAIVATVDLCLKYGKELGKICCALKGVDAAIEERVLRLENGWHRCKTQLNFLQQIHRLMDDEHRLLYEQTLHMLIGKLNAATSIMKGLVKIQADDNDPDETRLIPKPVKYAFKKEKLDEAIDTLETWQRLSDPSWFLILKMNDTRVDDALQQSSRLRSMPSTSVIRMSLQRTTSKTKDATGLALPPANLHEMDIEDIPFSNAKTARRKDSSSVYIIEKVNSVESNLAAITRKNVRDLASRLQHDEPHTFGLLNCKGFVAERGDQSTSKPQTTFTMVFGTPTGLTGPRSLRDYLVNTREPSSLSHRFSIAQQLAKSISYVHIFGFVHKNVRPETVIAFKDQRKEDPVVFMVGFEDFRREDGRTRRRGDDAVERNLYRHPTRQGFSPEDDFIMQHDIYSLGVCLLEIGLWHSFVQHDPLNETTVLSAFLKTNHNSSKEDIAEFLLTSAKNRFVELARSQLRECMGTRYSDIVETCLTCLDPDNGDFGDQREFEDEDGIRVGVRYIEKVLGRLNTLCV